MYPEVPANRTLTEEAPMNGALAGLWASPVSGASMNPACSLGPALVSGDLHSTWI
jgi:glycerol uptake facilitator-like aquaporin